jgi:cell division protein FtsB
MSPRTSTARAPQRAVPVRQPERTRPPLKLVKPGELPRLRPGRVGTVAVVLLFGALFALAAFQTVIIRSQGHLDDVNARIQAEESRQQALELELADRQSPERITSAARALGMIAPGEITFLLPSPGDDAAAAYAEPVEPGASAASGPTPAP